MIALILVILHLEETLHIAKQELASLADDDDDGVGIALQEPDDQPSTMTNAADSSSSGEAEVYLSDAAKKTSFWSLVKQRDIMVAATLYTLIGTASDSIEEVLPLWLLLSAPTGGICCRTSFITETN